MLEMMRTMPASTGELKLRCVHEYLRACLDSGMREEGRDEDGDDPDRALAVEPVRGFCRGFGTPRFSTLPGSTYLCDATWKGDGGMVLE